MPKLTVLGGDFRSGSARMDRHTIHLVDQDTGQATAMPLAELEDLEILNERTVEDDGRAFGYGALGGLAFGMWGALFGAILGGVRSEVTFEAWFRDGRTLVGTTDPDDYNSYLLWALRNIDVERRLEDPDP